MAVDGRVLRARAKKEQTRERILDVARTLFGERGYDAVSIDDILKRADIARGTFYLHFDTKVALVGALLDELVGRLTAAIVPATEQGELLGNFTRIVDVLCDDEDTGRLILTQTEPALAEKMEAFNHHALAMIKGSLKAGRKLGILREVDLELAAVVVYGGIRETALRRLFGRRVSRAQRHALAGELLSILLSGLLKK